MEEKALKNRILSQSEIDQCISALEHLLDNAEQLSYINEERRIALMKAAGQLSRPDRVQLKKGTRV